MSFSRRLGVAWWPWHSAPRRACRQGDRPYVLPPSFAGCECETRSHAHFKITAARVSRDSRAPTGTRRVPRHGVTRRPHARFSHECVYVAPHVHVYVVARRMTLLHVLYPNAGAGPSGTCGAEDCGASCPSPPLPPFAQLPSVAALNDPFAFQNGTRITTASQWCVQPCSASGGPVRAATLLDSRSSSACHSGFAFATRIM